MMNLIEAWGNYYFVVDGDGVDDDRYFKITRILGNTHVVYENVEDDINVRVFSGSLEECIEYLDTLGAVNYDPLAKWR